MKTMVVVLLCALPIAVQEKRPPLPKRGDTVVVKGCLDGAKIESNSVKVRDGDGEFKGLATYRLTGDKKVIEELKKTHDGHADVLTAVLKSELPRDEHRSIGNTRITMGLPRMETNAPPPVPVLEVKSFEHTDVTCR